MGVTPSDSRTIEDAPELAVLIGAEASLSSADVLVSADGLARIRFLIDTGDATDPLLHQVASGLAPTTVVDFSDEEAVTAAARRTGATTVTTFVERLCPLAARVNRRLGGDGGDAVWGRKELQRDRLRAAGLSRIRSARPAGPEQLREFARQVGYPLVVKPVDGFASRDTWSLTGPEDLAALLRQRSADGLDGLFVEEFIAGTDPAQPWLADYFSVEVLRPDSRAGAAPAGFLTHRPPLAWPFRETGLVLPSPLLAGEQAELIAHGGRVLDVLQAPRGAYHVEIKPSPQGPEVIEVNGRIGGFINRGVRFGTGQDLGRLAINCVLGRRPEVDLRWDRCVLGLLHQPPAAARRVVRAPLRRELHRLPGVIAVDAVAAVGTAVHWRNGTFGMVTALWLEADDHAELQARLVGVTEFLTERFGYVDGQGRAVHDLSWLERVSRRPERGTHATH